MVSPVGLFLKHIASLTLNQGDFHAMQRRKVIHVRGRIAFTGPPPWCRAGPPENIAVMGACCACGWRGVPGRVGYVLRVARGLWGIVASLAGWRGWRILIDLPPVVVVPDCARPCYMGV